MWKVPAVFIIHIFLMYNYKCDKRKKLWTVITSEMGGLHFDPNKHFIIKQHQILSAFHRSYSYSTSSSIMSHLLQSIGIVVLNSSHHLGQRFNCQPVTCNPLLRSFLHYILLNCILWPQARYLHFKMENSTAKFYLINSLHTRLKAPHS